MTEIFKAKTIDEAKKLASKKFGVSADEISFNIIKEPKKGFFGLGSTDAEVEAVYTPAEASVEPEKPVEAPIEPEKPAEAPVEPEKPAEAPVEPEKPAEASVEPIKPVEAPVESEKAFPDDDEEEYSLDNFTLIEDEALLNPKAKIAKDYIISVLSAMGLNASAKIYQNDTGAVIELESNSNGTIIGRRGETLDALQYLSSMISNKGDKEYFRITIDCFGYREKRKVTLQQLASKVARNVLKTGRSQPLEPMNPYERRVIHSAISQIDGVSSRSVGEEPYRKIIISSTNPKKKNSDKPKGKGGKKFNGRKRLRRESKDIDLSTSFEKDYKKPKPEDSIEGGLYGKIEF